MATKNLNGHKRIIISVERGCGMLVGRGESHSLGKIEVTKKKKKLTKV